MRIYIRHAAKAYRNGGSSQFGHDPPIIPQAMEDIHKMTTRLEQKYGRPDKIICSPFLRARTTAQFINVYLTQPVPILVDVSISEYLGNHYDTQLDVTPETSSYNPPHPEKYASFFERVQAHFDHSEDNVWYVTHGIVIQTIGKFRSYIIRKVQNLGCLIVGDREIQIVNPATWNSEPRSSGQRSLSHPK
jgi:broad specificity phosphatase PhoE